MRRKKKRNQMENQVEKKSGVRVNIDINVDKIVRYLSITAVMIVGIIFGASVFKTYLQVGGSAAIALLEKGKKFSE